MATDQGESKPLSKKRKRELDALFDYLVEYFQTPEGIAKSEEIHDFLVLWKARRQESLTKQEEKALNYIRHELKREHPPSVRDVARALGLKSSRSGFRVVESLIGKGMLERTDKSTLILPYGK